MTTVSVITGAGGMGVPTARNLGTDHHIVLFDNSQDRLDAAVAALDGIEVTTVLGDVTDRAAVDALFATATGIGPIASVVHTAGVSPSMGDAEFISRINALGTVNVDEALLALASGAVADGAVLVDGRNPEEFALGHLRGAVNIGLEGRYAEFAGSVIKPDVDIVLFAEPGQELEGKNRLARIGFDRVVGCVTDPERAMFEHQQDVQVASRLTTAAFGERAANVPDLQIVDVRNPGEAEAGMIPGAVNIPVGQLPDRLGELDPARPTVVYCAGGYRSAIASRALKPSMIQWRYQLSLAACSTPNSLFRYLRIRRLLIG